MHRGRYFAMSAGRGRGGKLEEGRRSVLFKNLAASFAAWVMSPRAPSRVPGYAVAVTSLRTDQELRVVKDA